MKTPPKNDPPSRERGGAPPLSREGCRVPPPLQIGGGTPPLSGEGGGTPPSLERGGNRVKMGENRRFSSIFVQKGQKSTKKVDFRTPRFSKTRKVEKRPFFGLFWTFLRAFLPPPLGTPPPKWRDRAYVRKSDPQGGYLRGSGGGFWLIFDEKTSKIVHFTV